MKVASAAQMREMDRQTIEEYGVPSIVLMENAALRVVEEMARRYAPLAGKRIAVVCGKGNNGGDGLAIARHLATRYGAKVTVWLAAEASDLTGDAATNYKMAESYGLEVQSFGAMPSVALLQALAYAHIVVDALLGTGARGAVTGPAVQAVSALAARRDDRIVVSVDVPSGLEADTGDVPGPCVRADLTVTFALPKFGLLVFPGAEYVGELVIADIGMPRPVMAAPAVNVQATEAADVARWVPPRVEGRDSNKGTFGHVTVFAGSRGFVGAPSMAADAAARMGAGLVTLATPQGIQNTIAAVVSPVVMTKGLPETDDGTFSRDALEPALKLAEKGTVAALGPGIGRQNEETQTFVREFIARCPVPLVIDADALNILADEPDHGAARVKARPAPTVLTPHPAEMGRLRGIDTPSVQADRRTAVGTAAHDFGCVVLLKGARTLIASPAGALWINTTSNAGMGTGGAGDVLTGVIAALLAGRLGPAEAAAAGAYLHGMAGDLVAEAQGGKVGLIATDLVEWLPRALARCQKEGA